MKKAFLSLALAVCTLTASAQYFDREYTDTARISALHNNKGEDLSLTAIRFDRTTTGEASCVIEYNRPAADLYLFSRMWLAENVPNYTKNKQLEDNRDFILITSLPLTLFAKSNKMDRTVTHDGIQSMKVTIRCKEGRLRLQCSEYTASYSDEIQFGTMTQTMTSHSAENYNMTRDWITPDSFDPQYTQILNNLIKSLAHSIIKQDSDNDF